MRKFTLIALIAAAGLLLLTGAAWADDFSSHYRIFGQLNEEKGDEDRDSAPAARAEEARQEGGRIFGTLNRKGEEKERVQQMAGMVGRPSSKALNSNVTPGDAP